jgi:hypothetical protein
LSRLLQNESVANWNMGKGGPISAG